MNRPTPVFFLLSILISLSCSANAPSFRVSAISSLERAPFDKPLEGAADSAFISAAGGEYESFQLVVHEVTRALDSVRCEVSDLSGPSGLIPADRITLNPVGYVETTVISKQYPSSLGWWPDPLLNMESFPVDSGQAQPVWVTVHVPEGTPKGLYRGEIEVTCAGGGSRVLPVTVRVRGFDIPKKSSLKTLTWVKPGNQISAFEVDKAKDLEALTKERETLLSYYDILLDHRLGPGGRLDMTDETLQHCLDRGMNCFILENIRSLKETKEKDYTPGYTDSLSARLRGYVERFGPRGWLADGTAYVYNYDEVDRPHWPLAKRMYKLVKEISPELKVIQCLNIPEGVRAMAGYADTWDVYIQQYDSTGVKERVAEGDEAWQAICCWPVEHPNNYLEYPSIDRRIIGWILWKTGVSGFEYWCPNHWKGNTGSPGLRGGWIANTFLDYNGDGYLLYPDKDGKPLSSIRLECLRDGFEDYEYLALLKKLGGDASIPEELVAGTRVFSSEPELLIQKREKVADEIEKLLEKQ